jgi:TRAP transporter TAXI family solute receptor
VLLLEAFNVPLTSVQLHNLPSIEAAQGLTRGELDAVFVLAADPSGTIHDALTGGARLLEIDNDTLIRLRDNYPFLRPALTAQLTDDGSMQPVHTVGIDTLLVTRAGLSEHLVSEITRAFFEALPELGADLQTWQLAEPDRAAATPIPLHPGAARYYRERELFQ